MKRLLIIFYSVLVVFMTGCTADMYNRDTSVENRGEAWMYDETLPVPIILGCESDDTKAVINTLKDLNNKMFGTFAINNESPTVDPLFMNVLSQCQYDHTSQTTRFYFGTRTDLSKPEYAMYYPLATDTNYNFYSYYVYQKDNAVVVDWPESEVSGDGTKILVNLPVGKDTDVLWGKAEVSEEEAKVYGGGYNAKFLRQGGSNPKFHFRHPAAGLSFTASLDDGTVINDPWVIRVHSLKFYDIYTKAQLCVCDCAEGHEQEGQLVGISKGNTYLAPFSNNGSGNLIVDIKSTKQVPIGWDLFIVPQKEPIECVLFLDRGQYTGNILPNGDKEFWNPSPRYYRFFLDPADFGLENGFEAGKYYRFNFYIGHKSSLPQLNYIGTRLPEDLN